MADPLIGGALSLDSTLQWASLKLDSTLNLIPCNLQTPNAQVPISYAHQNPELLHSKLYPGPSPCRPQAQAVVSSDVAFSIYGFGFPFRPKRYLQAFTCGTSSSRQTSQKGCICWIQQPPPPRLRLAVVKTRWIVCGGCKLLREQALGSSALAEANYTPNL